MKVFCDLDGTLLDVAPRHYRVYQETVREFHGIPISQSKYWDQKRRKVTWPTLLNESKLSQEIELKFLDSFIKKIEDPNYLSNDELFPQSIAALETLKRNHELYLVSLRRSEKNLTDQINNLGLKPYFTHILSGHSEADGYDKKIELIKTILGSDRGVIIGDTEADVIAGKELGLMTIAVTSGIRDEQFLAKLNPDYLVNHIGDINELKLV